MIQPQVIASHGQGAQAPAAGVSIARAKIRPRVKSCSVVEAPCGGKIRPLATPGGANAVLASHDSATGYVLFLRSQSMVRP